MLKRRLLLLIAMLCIILMLMSLFLTLPVYAHSGRTDSKGGHINYSTGEYHYHHGYSAHQHPNGVCPYSSSNTSNNQSDSSNSDKSESKLSAVLEALGLGFVVLFLCVTMPLLYVYITSKINNRKNK